VSVDPHFAVPVHSVEFDERQLFPVRFGKSECLSVPSYAARQRPSAHAGRIVFAEFAFDAPVVRNIEQSPMRIIKGRDLSVFQIAKMKMPCLPKFSVFLAPVPPEAVPDDVVTEKRKARRKRAGSVFIRTLAMRQNGFGFPCIGVCPFTVQLKSMFIEGEDGRRGNNRVSPG